MASPTIVVQSCHSCCDSQNTTKDPPHHPSLTHAPGKPALSYLNHKFLINHILRHTKPSVTHELCICIMRLAIHKGDFSPPALCVETLPSGASGLQCQGLQVVGAHSLGDLPGHRWFVGEGSHIKRKQLVHTKTRHFEEVGIVPPVLEM